MSWAKHYIDKLQKGEVVTFRPRGNSMIPKIYSGQLCTVEPITDYSKLEVGNIVLCKVAGSDYLHLISSINVYKTDGIENRTFTISNNKGHINGTISTNKIYGICTKIEN